MLSIQTAEQFDLSSSRTYKPEMLMLHIAAGLAGEAGEILELGLLEDEEWLDPSLRPKVTDYHNEMGDLHWYIAAACRKLGSSYAEIWKRPVTDRKITNRKHTAASLSVLVSKVVDKIKKIEGHGREELRAGLLEDLGGIMFASMDVSRGRMEYSWSANHEKLLKRYPEGFVKGGGIR